MPNMISKVSHIYDGRTLVTGERFFADDKLAVLMVHLGRAEIEVDPPAYATRHMEASEPAQYQRQDMTAVRVKRKYTRRSHL